MLDGIQRPDRAADRLGLPKPDRTEIASVNIGWNKHQHWCAACQDRYRDASHDFPRVHHPSGMLLPLPDQFEPQIEGRGDQSPARRSGKAHDCLG
jgi:hypothetical protein